MAARAGAAPWGRLRRQPRLAAELGAARRIDRYVEDVAPERLDQVPRAFVFRLPDQHDLGRTVHPVLAEYGSALRVAVGEPARIGLQALGSGRALFEGQVRDEERQGGPAPFNEASSLLRRNAPPLERCGRG